MSCDILSHTKGDGKERARARARVCVCVLEGGRGAVMSVLRRIYMYEVHFFPPKTATWLGEGLAPCAAVHVHKFLHSSNRGRVWASVRCEAHWG
jgi:hypothetical protein